MNNRLLWVAPIATVAILFGSYGVATATGVWVSSGKTVIDETTRLTADDLKGWMTLDQAATGLGVDVQRLIALVGAPAGVTLTPATAFKDVEALVPGFELSAFREQVRALQGGAPQADPSAGPTPVAPSPVASGASGAPTSAHQPTSDPAGGAITGQSTIRQIAEANGLDPAVLAREAGLPPMAGHDVALKDLKSAVAGWEIQNVRDAVERLT